MLRTALRVALPLFLATAQFACGVGADESVVVEDTLGESQDELALSTGRFETFIGKDGRYYFHLLAGNGEKVLASQGYTSVDGALNGIESVKANGTDVARYQLAEAVNGEWYFRLKARNGQVIALAETYASQSNAERGVSTVAAIVTNTVANEPAPLGSRFQVFKGLDAKYYFHLRAANGEIVLQSQGYTVKSSATSGTLSVQKNGADAARYELRETTDGAAYFVLKAGNGQIIGRSEVYASKSNAQRGIDTCVELLRPAASGQ